MCPLLRVSDEEAGPAALGVLVPPGRRTFLILRPRSLSLDLLLIQSPQSGAFRQLSPEEAAIVAQKVYRCLEQCEADPGPVRPMAAPAGPGWWLQAVVGPFALLVCPRLPGQPYQPQVFADVDSAWAVARALAAILCPPAGVEQEIYFNTRHFHP
jgi:hypothetical protein